MSYTIPEHVLDNSVALARAGRIIGGRWRRQVGDVELVCALASWEKGVKINSVSDCPASYAPAWLIELIPNLNDGLPDDTGVGTEVARVYSLEWARSQYSWHAEAFTCFAAWIEEWARGREVH